MTQTCVTLDDFLADRQGKSFADVANDPEQPLDIVLEFFNDEDRQRRMEESELHRDRFSLTEDVREPESQPALDHFQGRSARLRQAVGVLVRMITDRHGWTKAGKSGSLGMHWHDRGEVLVVDARAGERTAYVVERRLQAIQFAVDRGD